MNISGQLLMSCMGIATGFDLRGALYISFCLKDICLLIKKRPDTIPVSGLG